ncbi:MAG: hypothetical protein K6B44_08715 [Lachnospiraceae bacterium]|nr:hypothetical protein [Lachnospiraceae bacterium]
MKKRLLAMLLAVVTTISSVPTPVYAAADEDAVVDFVDEETDAEAVEDEFVDDAEVATEAPVEEAVVAEENTEAAPAADEAVEEAAPEVVAAPAETAGEEAGDVEIKKEMTEEDAVTFAIAGGVAATAARSFVPNNASLYGNTNYRFTEGEYDYQGGIYDTNRVIYVTPSGASMKNNDEYTPVYVEGSDLSDKIKYEYKFELAEGWNKDDKSKLSFQTITPGSVVTVGGLQVSANEAWLHDKVANNVTKVSLVQGKDKDYYIDNDGVIWVNDSYGVGRKATKIGGCAIGTYFQYRSDDDYTLRYTWNGFKNGVWGTYSIYHDAKKNADGTDDELKGEAYVFDNEHGWRNNEDVEEVKNVADPVSVNSISVVSVNKAGVYTLKSSITYTVSRNTIPGNDLIGDDEIVKVTDVGYATIFVRIKNDENAGWGKVQYELEQDVFNEDGTVGKETKKYVEDPAVYGLDYSKIAGLEASKKYKVTWTATNGSPASNYYTADKNGEFKSDKYWARNNAFGTLIKVSDAEANGNCDSAGVAIAMATTGASYFDKMVFAGKTAPGLYGDKDHNNYNAAEKESVKIAGIYGDDKFVEMRMENTQNRVINANAAVVYKADIFKGTADVYPAQAGISIVNGDIRHSYETVDMGVKGTATRWTGSASNIVMIVKEAVPQGRVTGTESRMCPNPETAVPEPHDCLVISGLEAGTYRVRAVSNNEILKNVIVGCDGDGEYTTVAATKGLGGDIVGSVDVKGLDNVWTTNDEYAIVIDSAVLKADQTKLRLEKINAANQALNSYQDIVLNADEVYVNIIPPMAGHTPVDGADVERGTLATKNFNNIGVDPVFDGGQEGEGYNVFYNVDSVDFGIKHDEYFELDKVYTATVTMSISSNKTISSNVAFRSDLKAEDIHINDGIGIAIDAGWRDLSVAAKDISGIALSNNNKTLTFKVTFPKAFVQHDVHVVNVWANGRMVTGYDYATDEAGLADPVIYVAPGQEVSVEVYAENRWGNDPSLPAISVNGTLSNGKFLWDEEHFYTTTRHITGTLTDTETGIGYDFETYDGKTWEVTDSLWPHVVDDFYSNADFVKEFMDKYELTAWNAAALPSAYMFTISGNAAASGEDKITFTAQNGKVESKQISVRYYKKADTPAPEVVYDRLIEDKYAPFSRAVVDGDKVTHYGDYITKLKPHTWYIISWRNSDTGRDSTGSFYSDSDGEIFIGNSDWYVASNRHPISISEAYGEQPQKAASDPVDVVIKQTLTYDKLFAKVNAPEDGGDPIVPATNAINSRLYNTTTLTRVGTAVTISINSAKWVDDTGKTMVNGVDTFAKDKTYNLSFIVKLNKYAYDDDHDWVASDKGESIYRNLGNVTISVPGDIVKDGKESVSQDYVRKDGKADGEIVDDSFIVVSAAFKVSDPGKVPVAIVQIGAQNMSYEIPAPYYVRSDAAGAFEGYAVSEGWKQAEGEVYLNMGNVFPANAANAEGAVYADATGSVDVSISMNDINDKKTRAQISGNKVVGEDAQITAKVFNADGTTTENAYVYTGAYVKLAAPYTANNVDNTNYITGLEKAAHYYAYSDNFGSDEYHIDPSNGMYDNRYFGVAYEYSFEGGVKATGFKRLTSWTDVNTVFIKKTYQGDETHEASSKYDSVYASVKLSKLIPKKGLYVTWPYGMTDDTRTYTYDGTKKTPEVWVWYDGERLDKNFYKVTYKNNVNVSTDKKKASIVVSGKNGVKGKANKMEFIISPRDIWDTTTYTADGLANTITVKKGTALKKIKFNLYLGGYTKPLKAKKDYTIESATATFNKDGWILVTGKGNYTGTKLIKVIVTDKIQKLNITLANKGKVEYSYYKDGIAYVKPSMTVTIGKGKSAGKLAEELDYRVYVEENEKANGWGVHNVGTYKVYVFGQGIYGNNGKPVKKTFKITPKKFKPDEITTNMDKIAAWEAGYQFDNIMGATLKRGFDNASVVAPDLTIVANNVTLNYSYNSKKYVTMDTYGYNKEMGKKVGYDNMGNERTYKHVDSITIKYSGNKKLGVGKYTIKFGGNFKGTKAIKGGKFNIKATTLTAAGGFNGNTENMVDENYNAVDQYHNKVNDIVIPDMAYTGKAGTYYSNPLIFYRNTTERVNGYTGPKQITYKKGRDFTVKYYKDANYRDEITGKNKIVLTPGQEYVTVYVRIEGKGGYSESTYQMDRAITSSYKVYDPKKVQGGCLDLKSMKYYNGDAKPVKVKIQYTPSGLVLTTGSGKKLQTITNDMWGDGFRYDAIRRSSAQAPNWQLSMYGVGDIREDNDNNPAPLVWNATLGIFENAFYRPEVNGTVLGFRNMKVTVNGKLEKEWFR